MITENFSGISGGVRRFSVYIAKDTLDQLNNSIDQVSPLCPLNTRKYCFVSNLTTILRKYWSSRKRHPLWLYKPIERLYMLFWGYFFPWVFGHAVFSRRHVTWCVPSPSANHKSFRHCSRCQDGNYRSAGPCVLHGRRERNVLRPPRCLWGGMCRLLPKKWTEMGG